MADNDSGGMTAIVAILAIIVILGIGYFVFQNIRQDAEPTSVIDVNIPSGQDAE
jgi:hypothetical protein